MEDKEPFEGTNGDLRCSECLQQAEGHWEDFGIGPYEFWGSPGNQTDLGFVSNCCEAPMQEKSKDLWIDCFREPPSRVY